MLENETISFQEGLKLLRTLLRQDDAGFDTKPSNDFKNAPKLTNTAPMPHPYKLYSSKTGTKNGDQSDFEKLEGVRSTPIISQRYAYLLSGKPSKTFILKDL